MKLGIIAKPVEESFIMAKEKGLEFLEFCINGRVDNNSTENVKELYANINLIKGYIEKYNVSVGSIGRWGSNRIDVDGNVIEEELEAAKILIDCASAFGCKNFISGCNYVDSLSLYDNYTAAIKWFSLLIEYGKQKDVNISVYNCRWNNYIVNPESWKVVHGHLKDLGIKFDPSHSIYAGGDYLAEMRDWGHRFYHVHLKGSLPINNIRFDDPPAGLDITNWGAFMSILYAKKYNGTLSIEPHSETWKNELGKKGIDYTIDYFKKMIF